MRAEPACRVPTPGQPRPAPAADYKEHHTDVSVRFVVTLTERKMQEALATGLLEKFKLKSKISTSEQGGARGWPRWAAQAPAGLAPCELRRPCAGNMVLFNSKGLIQKYSSPEDILREFFDLRLQFYVKRKAALLRVRAAWGARCRRPLGPALEAGRRGAQQPRVHRPLPPPPPLLQSAEADLLRISNKVRFILAVVSGELKLSNRRKADVEAQLEDEGYDRLASQKKAAAQVGARPLWRRLLPLALAALGDCCRTTTAACGAPSHAQVAADVEEEEGAAAAGESASYDYLLSMPLSSLTLEKVGQAQGVPPRLVAAAGSAPWWSSHSAGPSPLPRHPAGGGAEAGGPGAQGDGGAAARHHREGDVVDRSRCVPRGGGGGHAPCGHRGDVYLLVLAPAVGRAAHPPLPMLPAGL